MGKNSAWAKSDIDYLCKNYGMSTNKDIGLVLNRNSHAIQEYARRRGLKKSKDHKYTNTTLQKLLDGSNESYYWIGVLFSDGYIFRPLNQVVLSLAYNDIEMMNAFSKYINCPIKKYVSIKSGFRSANGFQYRISAADKNAVPHIIKRFDFKEQKTYNPPDLNILKKEINTSDKFLSFFAGFVDGDGSIFKVSKTKCINLKIENHASWKGFLEFLISQLEHYGFLSKPKNVNISKRGYAGFAIADQKDIWKIRTAIENLKIPFSRRKWDKINYKIPPLTKYEAKVKIVLNRLSEGLNAGQISKQEKMSYQSVCLILKKKREGLLT